MGNKIEDDEDRMKGKCRTLLGVEMEEDKMGRGVDRKNKTEEEEEEEQEAGCL